MRRVTVLYDPGCGFCRAVSRALVRLDWRHRLTMCPARDAITLGSRAVVPLSALLTELHAIDDGDRVFSGFFACRRIARSVPLFWPLLPLLYAPGAPLLGRPAYAWAARHRMLLSRLLLRG